jgi:hypothetical protein
MALTVHFLIKRRQNVAVLHLSSKNAVRENAIGTP